MPLPNPLKLLYQNTTDWWFKNDKHFFFTVLGAENQDQHACTGWVLVKILLQDENCQLLSFSWPGGKNINLNNLPQLPPSHTDTLDFRISTNKIFEYIIHVETIAGSYRNCDWEFFTLRTWKTCPFLLSFTDSDNKYVVIDICFSLLVMGYSSLPAFKFLFAS